MRPMSLFESGESNGEVSIKALFDENPGESLASVNGLSVEDISYLVCRGGWPRAVLQKDKEIALDQALNYYVPLKTCGEVGSCIAAKVVEVVGTKIDIPRWRVAKQEIRDLIASAAR